MTVADGVWLREWRKRNNYTQETLAAELDVNRQTVINWEKSEKLDRLVVLALTALEHVPSAHKIGARRPIARWI